MGPVSKPTNGAADSADASSPLAGLRFNATGQDDTAAKVLRPQRDLSSGRRTGLVVAIVVTATVIVGVFSYYRSDLRIGDVFKDRNQPSFGSQSTSHAVDQDN